MEQRFGQITRGQTSRKNAHGINNLVIYTPCNLAAPCIYLSIHLSIHLSVYPSIYPQCWSVIYFPQCFLRYFLKKTGFFFEKYRFMKFVMVTRDQNDQKKIGGFSVFLSFRSRVTKKNGFFSIKTHNFAFFIQKVKKNKKNAFFIPPELFPCFF